MGKYLSADSLESLKAILIDICKQAISDSDLQTLPQIVESLRAATEANASNIALKANSADLVELQAQLSALTSQLETATGVNQEQAEQIAAILAQISADDDAAQIADLLRQINAIAGNVDALANGQIVPKANQTDFESLSAKVNLNTADIAKKLDAGANALSASELQTPRSINGTPFDGTADATIFPVVATVLNSASNIDTDSRSGFFVVPSGVGGIMPTNYTSTDNAILTAKRIASNGAKVQEFDNITKQTKHIRFYVTAWSAWKQVGIV